MEAVHFGIAESSHENTVDLGGSSDGTEEAVLLQANQGNRILYDVMKSRLSKNVRQVTSEHLAVGSHCINMLLGTGQDLNNEYSVHHTVDLKIEHKNQRKKEMLGSGINFRR